MRNCRSKVEFDVFRKVVDIINNITVTNRYSKILVDQIIKKAKFRIRIN